MCVFESVRQESFNDVHTDECVCEKSKVKAEYRLQ